MDNDFFLDAGITPLLHFDQPPIPTWHSLQPVDLHFPAPVIGDASPGCYFDSALSSMVSSPASASNSAMCNEGFVIRELIGKLGNICNSGGIPTPANVPVDFAGNQGNSIRPNLPAMPGDPGFADRAARFSSFRSRSFNCRTTQFGSPDGSGFNSNSGQEQLKAGRKLQRILSSPSLKVESENDMKVNRFPGDCGVDQGQLRNSIENSSISEQNHPFAENGSASRKRKSAPKPKSKQIPSSPTKVTQTKIDPIKKRIKSSEEDDGSKKEDNKTTNEKPPEPPKDYIHVRARRGQATDSHSLAERVRREKISERMKLLQDIVPGCNKVTGKALMLEEIINYVQSLQRQVEFLSMKVASVPPTMDFNTTNPFQNDMYQPNCGMQTSSMQQFNVLTPNFYSARQNGNAGDMSLPTTNDFINGAHRVQPLCEGDLQTIFEMGLKDNTVYTG